MLSQILNNTEKNWVSFLTSFTSVFVSLNCESLVNRSIPLLLPILKYMHSKNTIGDVKCSYAGLLSTKCIQNNVRLASPTLLIWQFSVNRISLASFLLDMGKQKSNRCGAEKRGVPSHSKNTISDVRSVVKCSYAGLLSIKCLQNDVRLASPTLLILQFSLTLISLASFLSNMGKQNSNRCNAEKRGVPSLAILFA